LLSCGLDAELIKLILNGVFHNFKHLNPIDFTRVYKSDIPRQANSIDCGMFICLYARYYLANDDFTFKQDMINNFRSHIKVELENMKLICITNIDLQASSL
jgi:Ulp1 family protease